MRAVRLAVLLVRRGGRRGATALALTALGVATATTLGLLAGAVGPAMGERADRIAWRVPARPVDGAAAAGQRTWHDRIDGRTIVVVDLATVDGATPPVPPVPPGMDAFPAPGTYALSPALADLVDERPDAELAGRFAGERLPDLHDDALAHDAELVAVVGVDPTAVRIDPDAAADPSYAEPGVLTPIGGFARSGHDPDLSLYGWLARIAAALLIVPCGLLIGSAARLTASRREQRLAALRLVGADGRTVVGVTLVETGLAALAGAVAGAVGYLALTPLAARLSLAGGSFTAGDLVLPLGVLAAIVLAVPVAAVIAAAWSLRRLVISPLGVARRAPQKAPTAARLLVVPVAWIALSRVTGGEGAVEATVLASLAGVIVALTVVGPWCTWLLGRFLSRLARRPSTLLAGRRLLADPRGAFRTVSGLVLAGVLAGFLFGVLPTVRADDLPDPNPRRIEVDQAIGRVDDVAAAVRSIDPAADVDLHESEGRSGAPLLLGTITVSDPSRLEPARTALLHASPGALLDTSYDSVDRSRTINADIERGAFGLALAALAMATAAVGVASVGSILDQRTSLARLRLAGTPVEVLQRARRWQFALPLTLALTGALATGTSVGSMLMVVLQVNRDRLQPPSVAPMALLAALAVGAGLAVVSATRPVLVAAGRSPLVDR